MLSGEKLCHAWEFSLKTSCSRQTIAVPSLKFRPKDSKCFQRVSFPMNYFPRWWTLNWITKRAKLLRFTGVKSMKVDCLSSLTMNFNVSWANLSLILGFLCQNKIKNSFAIFRHIYTGCVLLWIFKKISGKLMEPSSNCFFGTGPLSGDDGKLMHEQFESSRSVWKEFWILFLIIIFNNFPELLLRKSNQTSVKTKNISLSITFRPVFNSPTGKSSLNSRRYKSAHEL